MPHSTCTHVVTHVVRVIRVCVCATRSSTRPGFEQQMCIRDSLSLFPDGAGYEKGAPIFWQVPLSSSARRHLLTFNGPHEARRNVIFNWVNDHENPLRETPTEHAALNPSLLPKITFSLAICATDFFFRLLFRKSKK